MRGPGIKGRRHLAQVAVAVVDLCHLDARLGRVTKDLRHDEIGCAEPRTASRARAPKFWLREVLRTEAHCLLPHAAPPVPVGVTRLDPLEPPLRLCTTAR